MGSGVFLDCGDCHDRGLSASFFGDLAKRALFFAERAMIRFRLLATLFVVWLLSCDETLLIPGASFFGDAGVRFGDGGVGDFIP